VKSLGDGLMAVFDDARAAVQTARALHGLVQIGNDALPPERQMALRIGIHGTHLYADSNDVYGAGVNLAARLATLAGPGETIVSANVRDGLTDGLDAVVEDLGECFLKNVVGPTRVYRVGSAGPHSVVPGRRDFTGALQPTIAVVPFETRSSDSEHFAIGELIADGVIVRLSLGRHFRVISRLSTTSFRGRSSGSGDIHAHLQATYVVTGSYRIVSDRILVLWELCDVRDDRVVKAGRIAGVVTDLLQFRSEIVEEIACGVHDAIFRLEVDRVQGQPFPTLQSYSMLLAAVHLLHRSSKRDFEASFNLLDHLAQKHPNSIEPRIWQAKWYALRAVQGLTSDRQADARAALACTSFALNAEPTNSFALAMQGFVHCHLSRDYESAAASLTLSVAQNPSETFGHLFNGVTQGLIGDFQAGIESYQLAASTSPLDPAMYLLDSIGAYLHLGAGHHHEAMALAKRSLRQNRMHAHTWRILTIAQAESGQVDDARASLKQLLNVQPELTINKYLADWRAGDLTRRRFAEGLRLAGLTEA
jgi:TolB-like protein/tetratricopeptide (TPR) repeat protein